MSIYLYNVINNKQAVNNEVALYGKSFKNWCRAVNILLLPYMYSFPGKKHMDLTSVGCL